MLLKTGILILVILGEIALGIYSFLFTDSLIVRFSFFVLTCFLVAMLVFRFAGRTREDKVSSTPTPISKENISTAGSDENSEVNPV